MADKSCGLGLAVLKIKMMARVSVKQQEQDKW